MQIETVGRNANFELKKYLRNKFMGDAELWYDIVVEEFDTIEQFEEIFKQYYWGQQTQAKVRENLYNGGYNETFGTSRERYAMRKISNARQLEPPMMERDIIQHIARHFEEEICDVVTIHEICSIDRFLTYLRRIDDAKQFRRYRNKNYNTNTNTYNSNNQNRWVEGRAPYKNRGETHNNANTNTHNNTQNNNNKMNTNNNTNTQERRQDTNKEENYKNYNNQERNYPNYYNQRWNRFNEGRKQENGQERRYWDNRRYNGNMMRNSRDNSRDNSRNNSRNSSRERKSDPEETRGDTTQNTKRQTDTF